MLKSTRYSAATAVILFALCTLPCLGQAQGTQEPDKTPVTAPTPSPDQNIEELFKADESVEKEGKSDEPVDLQEIDPILYITDADNGRIVVMQSIKGVGYTSIGMPGYGYGRFLRPAQIWIDYARRMYVADSGNNRVIRIDRNTQQGWAEVGGLGEPLGVAVDGNGVYVSDTNNDRILIFDQLDDGAKPREVLTHPRIKRPADLWIDKEGALYICCGEDPPGGFLVKTWMDKDEENLRRWKFLDGDGFSGAHFQPQAVVTDDQGIRILDSSGTRLVTVKDIRGTRPKENAFRGDPRMRLSRPGGLAIDHRGFLFIADSGNDRILKLDPEGRVVDMFFILENDPQTMLANPRSIFIHSPAPLPPPPKKKDDKDE